MTHRIAPMTLLSVLIILAGMFSHVAWAPTDATAGAAVETCAMDAPSPCGCLPPTETAKPRGCCCVVEEPKDGSQPLPPAVRPVDGRPLVFVANACPRVTLLPNDQFRPRLLDAFGADQHAPNRRQHFRASIGVWVT